MKNKKVKILGKTVPLLTIVALAVISVTAVVYAALSFDSFEYVQIPPQGSTQVQVYEVPIEIIGGVDYIDCALSLYGSGVQGEAMDCNIQVSNLQPEMLTCNIIVSAIGTGEPEIIMSVPGTEIEGLDTWELSDYWTPLEATTYTFRVSIDPVSWTEP